MNAFSHREVRIVAALIEDLELPHPSVPLLISFVTEAVDPVFAANYIRGRLSSGEACTVVDDWIYIVRCITENGVPPPSPDDSARSAISRRDGGKCCITGEPGSFNDPLLVVPILPCPSGWVTDQGRIVNMLGAFFGEGYRDWWLSVAQHPQQMPPYRTHWLVRKSAARAFSKGLIRLDRMQPSMVEYEVNQVSIGPRRPIDVQGRYALLGDHSRSGIEKVDPRFVGTHARLCRSVQYIELAKEIASEIMSESLQPSGRRPTRHIKPYVRKCASFLSQLLPTKVFLPIWLLFPSKLRMAAYDVLIKVGKCMYGRPASASAIYRLPFGLYLRYPGHLATCRNEFNALQLVRQHTSIPAPEALDLVVKKSGTSGAPGDDDAYLLITRLPGVPLASCQDVLSDADCRRIATQMKDYLSQLRTIPKTVNPDMAICNTLGEACSDPRLRGWEPMGPFRDEAAFSAIMRFPDDPARRGHKIVFTHADLNPRNILVDRIVQPDGSHGWQVTGIVDWETAGYYPEYWDYTKALYEGFRWRRRYTNLVKEIFSALGDYSRELHVETESWAMADGI
ncbi:kinase-like domain-containing protein [Trametes punicea]|nr:kinase-like domain-containing protein [Trametes punicea]